MTVKRQKRNEIIEVAVTWDKILPKREKQKRLKYLALGADMCRTRPGWVANVRPAVMGALGTVANAMNLT